MRLERSRKSMPRYPIPVALMKCDPAVLKWTRGTDRPSLEKAQKIENPSRRNFIHSSPGHRLL
jgi:hypothetical protein